MQPTPTNGDHGSIDRFIALAQAEPGRMFATYEGETLTFGALHEMSDRVAAGLQNLGLLPGERAAVMLANSPAAIALLFALARYGAVWPPP